MKAILCVLFSILLLSCKKGVTGSGNDTNIPSLNTDVTNITKNSAKFGSAVSNGGSPLTAQGFCYSTTTNPTLASTIITGIGTDNMYATPSLNPSTTYYVRSYATNAKGTGYGEQETFTTLAPFTIGEVYGGGVVFYIDASGIHGLIRGSTSSGMPGYGYSNLIWGCKGTNVVGTNTIIGTGQANTLAILSACTTPNTAAKFCDNLILNGYSDWFLPSIDELNSMCNSMQTFERGNKYYWSSSQNNANTAIITGFEYCGSIPFTFPTTGLPKDLPEFVWPVRKF